MTPPNASSVPVTAAATAAGRGEVIPRTPAPRGPRRVSGPARARAVVPAPRPVGSTAGGALAVRVVHVARDVSAHRFMDRLVRGRLWLGIVAFGLFGIVAMQVSMLEMNAGMGRAVERAATLERSNATLRATVSRMSSGERIQEAAGRLGMVMPTPGQVRYLAAGSRARDARRAAELMRAPNPTPVATPAASAPPPSAPVGTAPPAGTPAPASIQPTATPAGQ